VLNRSRQDKIDPGSGDRPRPLAGAARRPPDLGRDIGRPGWLVHAFTLLILIGGVLGLGVYGLRAMTPGAPSPDRMASTLAAIAPAASLPGLPVSAVAAVKNSPARTEATPPPADNNRSVDRLAVTRRLAAERGDTLIDLIRASGAGDRDSHAVARVLGQRFNPRRLKLGQAMTAELRGPNSGALRLQRLVFEVDAVRRIIVERQTSDGFVASETRRQLAPATAYMAGTIDASLFVDAERAGIPPAIIIDMIRIFSFDVDFQREIWPGDRFEILYRQYLDKAGEVAKNGNILFARLTLKGKPVDLYRYAPGDGGRTEYFSPKGSSARRLLMKTPINGARLTSRYGRRRHPVLGYTRMHKGLDFGANRGTPVMAAGDGVVVMARRNGGFGNFVKIRHSGRYSTGYAHLSAFGKGVRKNRRVRQGQIIGYVGSTGLATGAHLHYEVYVKNRQINPLALRLPTGRQLKGAELARFRRTIAARGKQVATLRQSRAEARQTAAIDGGVKTGSAGLMPLRP